MYRTTPYVRHFLARFERDVKLYMACAALIGFSAFGIYSVLFNLYLLRMDYGVDLVGRFNAAGLLSFALFSPIASNWAHRAGYRRTLVGGMTLMVVGYLLMSLAGFFFGPLRTGWIAAVQVIINCGFATYMVNSSPFLMSATAADNRSLVFSLRGAVWPLFGFAGSVLAGALPQVFARLTDYGGLVPYQCSLLVASLVLAPSLVLFGSTAGDSGQEQSAAATEGENGTRPAAPLMAIGLISLLAAPGVAVARTFFNVYLDADAEDLAQETFVRVYEALHSLDDPTRFRSWFWAIASNLCRDHHKYSQHRVHLSVERDIDLDRQLMAAGPARDAELAHRIRMALENLDDERRMVVVLREYHELSYEEIAKTVGCSVGTVRWRLHAARQQLRASLSDSRPTGKRIGMRSARATTRAISAGSGVAQPILRTGCHTYSWCRARCRNGGRRACPREPTTSRSSR